MNPNYEDLLIACSAYLNSRKETCGSTPIEALEVLIDLDMKVIETIQTALQLRKLLNPS